MMLRPPSTRDGSLPHQINNSSAAADERLAHSKKRLQRILQRGQIFLCLSFALMTFTLNMIFFAKVNSGHNDIHANISDAPVFSDAPILNEEVAKRNKLKMRQRGRWRKSKGIRRTELYNSTRYHDDAAIESGDVEGAASSQALRMRRNKMRSTSNNDELAVVNGKRTPQTSSSSYYHPKVACFHLNGCEDFISEGIDLLPSLTRYSEDSIPIIGSRRSKTLRDSNTSHEDDDNDTINNSEATTCRQARSIESRTTIHPTCNDIHSLGFDDQMFDKDYSSRRGESIDLLAVGGANSVWKTTSSHNGENSILKTSKYLKAFDKDRLELYVLDAMVAGAEGNPQFFSLLQSENDVSKTSSSASTSSSSLPYSWNHIMPIYSHCYTAIIAPVASGTLKEYVTTYQETHNGDTIDPLDKLRLAVQVARGLYQMQMYRYGKPTFAHLDLNPNQYLVFHPQLQQFSNSERQHSDNIPVLQINDFNRGRFLHWDNQNNTCPFQFDGCDKNTRGSRWHAPDRFIGCIDVNERIDTFALGGIFFFLLSDGEPPFYNTRNFGDQIKKGEMPSVPKEAADHSGDHPAYDALSEMVVRCRALRIEDRPSSLEVVRMLEDKLRQIELGSM
mmetsp:Transcript_24505/g.48928  ORF Transcript_24505/g.48928 Transcript_24505/m.48928 type:complete len:617 (-) Transcript_24505:14-1864(-)